MVVVGRALAHTAKAGTPLPASQEALSLWVRDTRILKDVEQREQAEVFCRRGVYRTNLPDATGKQHEYIAMYHIIVGGDSLICTYSNGDGWSPKYYME